MAKKRKAWGGRRPGAGRKPLYESGVEFSVRMPQQLRDRLGEIAKADNVNNAEISEYSVCDYC